MNQLITTPSVELLADNFCSQCGQEVTTQDNFCRGCGNACHNIIVAEYASPNATTGMHTTNGNTSLGKNQAAETLQYVLNNRLIVAGIIAVIGPLGLPVLWFSPRFKPVTKIVVTTVYVLLTAVVPIVVTYFVLENSFKPLADAFGY